MRKGEQCMLHFGNMACLIIRSGTWKKEVKTSATMKTCEEVMAQACLAYPNVSNWSQVAQTKTKAVKHIIPEMCFSFRIWGISVILSHLVWAEADSHSVEYSSWLYSTDLLSAGFLL